MCKRSQIGDEQQVLISSPSAVAETVEILETDTLPVKTMAVLQSTGPGVHIGEELTQQIITLLARDKVVNIPMRTHFVMTLYGH